MKECLPEELADRVREAVPRLYTLPDAINIELLNVSENLVFLLTDQNGVKRYVLRVNRRGYHSSPELEGELLWMRAVRKETNLEIPDVIPSKAGRLIESIGSYTCTIFSFVSGAILKNIGKDELARVFREIGQITAILHNQAEHWDGASQIKRFTWDYETLIGKNCRWGSWQEYNGISEADKALFFEAHRKIKTRLDHFGKSPSRFGLIHSDLHVQNIIRQGSQLKVIDFDDCGFGWFLYDLASSLLSYSENLDFLIESWLSGYRTVRTLSKEDEAEIPTFILMRRLVRLGWLATHPQSHSAQIFDEKPYIEKTIELAKKYLVY